MKKIENFKNNANISGFNQMPENINKSGRPKKIYTVLTEQGYSKDDIRTAFGELAWYNIKELENLHRDKDKPAIVRIIANQFMLALDKGDFSKIREILEHTIGKPKQDIKTDFPNIGQNITPIEWIEDIKPDLSCLTDEELILMRELTKKIEDNN
jgi:hypothetical protein